MRNSKKSTEARLRQLEADLERLMPRCQCGKDISEAEFHLEPADQLRVIDLLQRCRDETAGNCICGRKLLACDPQKLTQPERLELMWALQRGKHR